MALKTILISGQDITNLFSTKRENLIYLKHTGIYLPAEDGGFSLFKRGGITLNDMGLGPDDIPPHIFIMPQDRLLAVREIQSSLNSRLLTKIQQSDTNTVRETLRELLDLSFSEPAPESLEGLSETVAILAEQFDNKAPAMRNLALLSNADYNTALHSVNVMSLTMSYAIYNKMSRQQCHDLGMAALLHDVGKISIDNSLLTAPRRLTDEEFAEIKKHPVYGYRILSKCKFRSRSVALAAYQHHEKLDGSGYPSGVTDISFAGRLIAIIDCYEAITSQDRPYRNAAKPFDALKIIRDEISENQFDRRIFERFLDSLT